MIGYNDITDTPGYKEEMLKEREEAKHEALYEEYMADHKDDAITPDDVTMALRVISIDDKHVEEICKQIPERNVDALFDLLAWYVDMMRDDRIKAEATNYAQNGGKE